MRNAEWLEVWPWRSWLRRLLPLGALALALLLTYVGVREGMIIPLAALAVVGAGGIIAFFTWQGNGEAQILGILWAAAFVRFAIPTGTQSKIPISLTLAGLVVGWWVINDLQVRRRLTLVPSPTRTPLLGFMATCVISYLWSITFRDPLVRPWRTWPVVQIGGLTVMELLPAVYLFAANKLRHRWVFDAMTYTFLLMGALVLVDIHLHLGRHLFDWIQTRPLFPTWLISTALALALVRKKWPWTLRLVMLLLVLGWGIHVFVFQFDWLSAWFPALLAMGLIGLLKSRKLLILIVILIVLYATFNWATIQEKLAFESVNSGETRLDAWKHNWRITSKHWLFGVGPAGYAVYYMSYFPMEAMATHSTYLDIFSQTGIVGLSFFLWFWGAVGLTLWRLWQRVKARDDWTTSFTLAALGGYVGALAAMALGDWIVPFVYTQQIGGFDYAVYTWMMLGAAEALWHLERERMGEVVRG